MKKRLTHNLGLKLAALFVACCLWVISMNINDPVTQRVYTVAVQLLNMNVLTKQVSMWKYWMIQIPFV